MRLPIRYAVNLQTGCWEWCGEINHKGYGRLWTGGKRYFAHRAYYEVTHGPIPEGHEIDHLCRNRRCVNPDHLEAVAPVENQRRARPFAKRRVVLGPDDVEFIRQSDLTQRELARRLGVSQSTISEARRGITWNDDLPLTYSERRELARTAA